MSFDKTRAMKSAERFLSQGKLRAAIGEYKKVVTENPNDFSTLNMMGDLYVKNSENGEAIKCFLRVAEHYFEQGFANKAIAIYNKIAKLDDSNIEVCERLAQLYQSRGSLAEARELYTKLAETYQKTGQKLEALEILKKIASLDPNNTEVYLTIGKACLQENQKADAVDAFAEAGCRFNQQQQFESAVAAFSKAILIQPHDPRTLKGFVEAKIGLGCADEAAATLEKALADNPYSRDLLILLADCYLDMNSPGKAEDTLITLVQQEPIHFPKFLDLVKAYMKDDDLESSVRVLNIAFEHLLGGGHSDVVNGWINEILTRAPEFIDGLRLSVKFHTWHRDGAEIRKSLERLAETARMTESVEDERFALGQLAAMTPLQTEYSKRLDELKEKHGAAPVETVPMIGEMPEFETFVGLNHDAEVDVDYGDIVERFDSNHEESTGDLSAPDENDTSFAFYEDAPAGFDQNEQVSLEAAIVAEGSAQNSQMSHADELRMQKEIESVEFYINQGYIDLASKCLEALVDEFGPNDKFSELSLSMQGFEDHGETAAYSGEFDINGDPGTFAAKATEYVEAAPVLESADVVADYHEVEVVEETVQLGTFEQESTHVDEMMSPAVNVFEQFRSDLGLEDVEEDNEGDYSTLYHTAIAYKEMGLLEDAIKEFQDAINLVEMNDGTRRYFQCANLLGHCFMMKGMPNLAITWFQRALETAGLDDEEIQALHYELASAYEAGGEKDKAFRHFEQVYALDVDFRDIGQRIQNLRENYSSSMIN
ncbi:MAG: tetratricopeptide repeat protein [Pyrinomonadaceae bacterium]|nr:tetratricopeptide repeat protein [Pyrinomonadaceae bacterium]